MKKVFVGMSGGVDSSVTAMLLKNQGYDVTGVFMRCYNLDGCAERDAEDARRGAGELGITFYVWDFEEEYKKRVVEYMIEGYRAGITPNPDVMCNKEIKFGLFLKRALAAGADYVATGHYVKIAKKENGTYALYAAKDTTKDQSYFLWMLTQAELQHCLFPVGDYLKTEVRAMAGKAGLSTADKKDSQGICFIGKISLDDFLKQHIPERRGALITTSGEKIGEHFGSEFYTIGERHIKADFKFQKTGGTHERQPFYVASKDTATNTLVVAEGDENPALYKDRVALFNINLIDSAYNVGGKSLTEAEVFARVRYRQPLFDAQISLTGNGTGHIIFKNPQKFVAPGQSAVWYSEDGEMLGGGIIL